MDVPVQIGESFPLQFAWRLPDGEILRAVFRADVLDIIPAADKFMVRLTELLAGTQEAPDGTPRDREQFNKLYWARVVALVGNRVTVAFETADGRPVQMRLTTLTGEHDFFWRYNTPPNKNAPETANGSEA
jgi:hypothetical protein